MASRAPDPLLMLADDIAGFTYDPLGYSIYAYPWQESGALIDMKGPRDWQADIMEDIREHLESPATRHTPLRLAVASGHGIGKSALISMLIGWAKDTCEDTRIVITANTETQLRTKTWPEVSKWNGLAITRDWWKPTKTGIFSIVPGHEEAWRVDAVTWSENNTEAFAGLHNMGKRIVVIFDEASKIADKVWEVTEGALTDEGTEIIWVAFGNPTQNTGRFRECFGKFRHLWKIRQIDSRDVEGTNKSYLDELVTTYGEDSDIVKVRVRGLFPSASSMQFVPGAVVDAARKRVVETDQNEPIVIGVDVARFGDDHSTIYFRQGRDARSIKPIRLHGVDTMQLAAKVAEQQRIYNAAMVCVDETGVGGGVVDRLKQMGLPVVGVSFGAKPLNAVRLGNGEKCANRRAEIWAIMREWLQGGAIPDDQTLADDLTGVEYSFNSRDEILLEAKEHMKKRGLASPDDADGLALTLAVPVLPSFYEDEDFYSHEDGRNTTTGY
ncbi:MAG: terminase [Pseudomonadota bacterium]